MALLAEAVIAKLTAFVEVVVLAPLARAHERDFIVGGGVAPLAEAVMVRLTTCVAVVGLAKRRGLARTLRLFGCRRLGRRRLVLFWRGRFGETEGGGKWLCWRGVR